MQSTDTFLKISYKALTLLLLIVVILITGLCAQKIPVGAGGYTLELPAGQKGPSDINNNPVTPKVSSTFNKPPITHEWWSSLIWQFQPNNPFSENIFAYPLSFHANAGGVGVGYTTQPIITQPVTTSQGYPAQEYHYEINQDLMVSVKNMIAEKTVVDDYTDWTVTALWENNNRTLRMTAGAGLPFAYFTFDGDSLVITAQSVPTIFYNNNGVLGVTINGRHYGLFGPSTGSWTIQGTTLELNSENHHYFSLAALPNSLPETVDLFHKHAYAFVTDTRVSWEYNQEKSELITNYKLTTQLQEKDKNLSDTPLVCLFPHQWLYAPGLAFLPYQYITPRGVLKLLAGSEFSTVMPVTGILPALPLLIDPKDHTSDKKINQSVPATSYDQEKLYSLVEEIYKQTPQERWPHDDTYWVGKDLGRMSALVFIADQLNFTKARDLFLQEIQEKLESWLSGTQKNIFYYDNTWRTAIGYPASFGSDTQLNDHHFHWGYFIIAAATVALYNPEWAAPENWGSMIEFLIKDANNPDRSDTQFPFLRHFDPYNGHGWANGPALFGAGNNEESSSEAINFATGVILWGAATNNTKLRDLGIYLYTTQHTGIQNYWFDINKLSFPPDFKKPTLGILWGNGGAYSIWWDGAVQELHGINFLPITGGSLYLGQNPEYLRTNQEYMEQFVTNPNKWNDIQASIKVFYDPIGAQNMINEPYTPEDGETKAHTYQWVYMMSALGHPDTTITASSPTAAAFIRDTTVTYVAYNPTTKPITVTFSDGTELSDIPAHQFKFTRKTGSSPKDRSSSSPTPIIQETDRASTLLKVLAQEQTHAQHTDGSLPTNQKPVHASSTDLTVTITPDSSGTTAQVIVTPQTPSKYIIIHYSINQEPQLNHLMNHDKNNNNPAWQWDISSIKPGDSITYWFTYEKNGPQFDTTPTSYIVS